MAIIETGRVRTRKSWDDCVSLSSVVNRFLSGLNIFTTAWATSFMLCRVVSVELACKRQFISV